MHVLLKYLGWDITQTGQTVETYWQLITFSLHFIQIHDFNLKSSTGHICSRQERNTRLREWEHLCGGAGWRVSGFSTYWITYCAGERSLGEHPRPASILFHKPHQRLSPCLECCWMVADVDLEQDLQKTMRLHVKCMTNQKVNIAHTSLFLSLFLSSLHVHASTTSAFALFQFWDK